MSNALSIEGVVRQLLQEERGTSKAGKEWSKREFVIETTGDQYPKMVCFTCFGDKTKLIESISVGQNVEVSFNMESREYNGRWFHNINAWKIEVGQSDQVTDQVPPEPERELPVDDSDLLPF